MKHFYKELDFFLDKIKNDEPFSLVRFHDGEWYIISKRFIDIRQKCNGEWKYDPNDDGDNELREHFINSLQYKDKNYYVGIMTNCSCLKEFKHGGHELLRDLSGQLVSNLTFASLFMYSNYSRVREEIIPLFREYEIIIVVNHKADVRELPFKVDKIFRVGTNAWIDDYSIIKDVKEYMDHKKGCLLLSCSGPLSNMLIHELHDGKNTYINFGSILDEYMFSKATRWYHYNFEKSDIKYWLLQHKCEWR